jgi:hypothetical protein
MNKRTLVLGLVAVGLFCGFYFGSPYWTFYRLRSAIGAQDADALRRYVDFPALRESLKGQFLVQSQRMAPEDPETLLNGAHRDEKYETFDEQMRAAAKAHCAEKLVEEAEQGRGPYKDFAALYAAVAAAHCPQKKISEDRVYGANLVDGMVDAYVTPEGLEHLLNGAHRDEKYETFDEQMRAAAKAHCAEKLVEEAEQERGPYKDFAALYAAVAAARCPMVKRYKDLDTFLVEVAPASERGQALVFVLDRTGLFAWKLAAVRLPQLL